MKIPALILVALLTGCTAIQQKSENYERAAAMTINPERIEIHYRRDGGTATFREIRCTGELCNTEE